MTNSELIVKNVISNSDLPSNISRLRDQKPSETTLVCQYNLTIRYKKPT